jgi:signal transduction histidine kinase/CheY-like chemotaxis protein
MRAAHDELGNRSETRVPHPGPSTHDLPLPVRNFAATRRALSIVFAASVLVPLLCLLGYGYFSFERTVTEAGDIIDRLSRVAEEQAAKVIDLNQAIGARVIDLLGEEGDTEIRAREAMLHRQLDAIGGGYPQVAAISIVGVDGQLLVSSRFLPVPDISIAGREDFIQARKIPRQPYFALPVPGSVTKTVVFNTAIGRTASNGDFLGIVMIALRQEYFTRFYDDLAGKSPELLIGLYRDDGRILARYPRASLGANPAPNAVFAAALRHRDTVGHVRLKSTIDGIERLVSYRRVAGYPLYVISGYERAGVIAEWRRHLVVVASLTALPCIAVWLLILFSLRRLRNEQLAWERWQSEIGLRLSAEASSRHLQRMGALGNLVANVAHDFNNLLQVVSANMALARRKGFRDVEHEVLAVERASDNAKSVARRLLSVARKQPLKQESLDLAVWLPAVEGLLRTTLGQKVRLVVDVSDDIWTVFTDATELELALINVALNARDAMTMGGRVVIRCENVSFAEDEDAALKGDYVLISATDNGEGMSQDIASRAFEPLFTTKVRGTGTGLGLAQVLAACEQAGGTARIDSAPGRGAAVKLYLRRYRAAPAAELTGLPVPDTCVSAGAARSVLVAEDNDEVAAAVAAVLETLGCTAQVVHSGDEAWEVLRAGGVFDLVLSDVQMPGKLTGIDLAERVRSERPAQKIALMTGYADELERATQLDIPVLAKPFNIDALQLLVPSLQL